MWTSNILYARIQLWGLYSDWGEFSPLLPIRPNKSNTNSHAHKSTIIYVSDRQMNLVPFHSICAAWDSRTGFTNWQPNACDFFVFFKYDCKITSKSAPSDLHFGNLFQIIPTHNWEIYRIQMSARFKMIVLARYYVQCIRKVFRPVPFFHNLLRYSLILKYI